MANLTTDIQVRFDATKLPSLAQIPAAISTTFWRGSLLYAHFGRATNQPLAQERFIGIAWQRAKDAPAGSLITIAVTGRFRFNCPNFLETNYGELFGINTVLSDNPSDLDIIDFGFAGPAGSLDEVSEEGVSGWLNIDRRA